MTDRNKILRKLRKLDLYDEKTNTIYDYTSNTVKKATLSNIRRLYIRILEDEVEQREYKGIRIRHREDRKTRLERASRNITRRLQRRIRRLRDKNTRYSITINYTNTLVSTRNDYVIATVEEEKKIIRNEPITTEEVKNILHRIEDEKNEIASATKHKVKLKSVNTIRLNTDQKLQDSKMFKCNFSLYNKKISNWVDSGNNMCVYEYLIHRYNNIHKLILTKERIYSIIFDDYLKEKRDYDKIYETGLNCWHLERFCKYLGIHMYCVDATNSLFYKYVPEKRNHHYPVLCFISSNNHLYPIEDKKYIYGYRNIASNNVKSKSVVDNSKKKKELKKIIVDTENLDKMLDDLIYIEKKLPVINRYNGTVQTIKCGDTIYSACPNKSKIQDYCKKLNLEFKGQHKVELGIQLFKNLYPNHKQSTFNCNVFKIFKDNNKSAFSYTFKEPTGNNIITRDINKCYTSILRDNIYDYPIFNVCDSIEKYDNKPLKVGFYWVETKNIFPLKGSGFYCYSTLLECQKLGISFTPTFQLVSSHRLPATYFKKFVNNAVKIDQFKTLVNTTIGFLNKIKTTFKQSRFTSDKNEAGYYFFNKFKGSVENNNKIHYANLWNDDLYEIETVSFSNKYENDIPLFQQIIETGWIRIYKLYKSLGGDLLCVKTDSVTVENPSKDVKITEEIGGVKIEPNPIIYKKWKLRKGKFNIELKDFDEVDEIQYLEDREECISNDNFDYVDKIVEDILTYEEGCYIDGRAGTGKSVIIRKLNKILDERDLNYVNLAPTNKASRNINGQTIHKFFAIGRNNKTINLKKLMKLKKLDYVFIDEISMVSSNLLRFLHLSKMNNPSIKIICVGDSWQLSPVKEKKHTNTYCLKYLCDFNKINLSVNKRFDKKLRNIAEKWYLTGKIDLLHFSGKYNKIERFLTYTNKKRKEINAEMMLKKRRIKKCLELKINMTFEDTNEIENAVSQDLILNIGMPIIARKNNLKFGICNNDEYKIVNFNKRFKTITINHKEKEEYTYDEFQEHFLPAYGITIHKSQGQTYDKPYMICEINKIMKCQESRSLLYVALTRARDKKLIRIEKTDIRIEKTEYNSSFISKKIDGYIQQDAKKNLKNDLTVDKVQKLVDNNENICRYCRRNLNQTNFTLDRVDSSLCHSINNVVLCCLSCNRKKNDLDVSVMS